MKNTTLTTLFVLTIFGFTQSCAQNQTIKLTDQEISDGWKLLWDGKTTEGWRGAKLDKFPAKGWQMKDGVLTILATDGAEAAGPGDIITNKT